MHTITTIKKVKLTIRLHGKTKSKTFTSPEPAIDWWAGLVNYDWWSRSGHLSNSPDRYVLFDRHYQTLRRRAKPIIEAYFR